MPTLAPNPYIGEEIPRRAYGQMVFNLIKFFSLTHRVDSEITDSYMLLALQAGGALVGDSLTGFYAAIWEVARFMNTVTGGEVQEVVFERGEAVCEHETCKLANEAEAALIEAAVRGDGSAVMGVCKAVVTEAHRRRKTKGEGVPKPETALFMLWSGALRQFLPPANPSDEG